MGGKISRVSATLINGCWDATYDEKGNAVWWPHTSIHGKPPKCKVLFVLNKKQTEKLNDIIGGRHYRDIYGKAYDYVLTLVAKKYPKRIEKF